MRIDNITLASCISIGAYNIIIGLSCLISNTNIKPTSFIGSGIIVIMLVIAIRLLSRDKKNFAISETGVKDE